MRSGPIYRGVIYLAEKNIRYGIFQLKVNAWVLTRPITIFFWRIILKHPVLFILHLSPYIPSNQFFLTLPHFFLSWSPIVVPFFLTPHLIWFYKRHFFLHDGHFCSDNHKLCSSTTMLNSHELNQNNKPKAKACN